ncbi:MAG: hypothetical protein IKX96_01360 [Firmicutes bacterium]|nr:hypothetical protein [Bacillota bacterium]
MKDKLSGLYKDKGAFWVVAALFAYAWLGYLFQAVTLALTRHSLSIPLSVAEGVLATIIAILFLLMAAAASKGEKPTAAFKHIAPAAGWALWLVALDVLYDFATDKLFAKATFTAAENPKGFLLTYFLVAAVFCILAGAVLVLMVSSAAGKRVGAKNLLAGTVLGAVGIVLMNVLPHGIARIAAYVPDKFHSVLTNFTVTSVSLLVASLLFVPLVVGICRNISAAVEPAAEQVSETPEEPETESASETETPAKKKLFAKAKNPAKEKPAKSAKPASPARGMVILISGIAAVAVTFALCILPSKSSPVKTIENDISTAISQAQLYGAAGDYMTASAYAETVKATINAWRGAVLGEDQLLREAASNYPLEDQIQLLYAHHFKDCSFFEKNLLASDDVSDEALLALLDYYSNATSDSSRIRRNEIVGMLIRRGVFNNIWLSPDKLKGKENDLAAMLNAQEARLEEGGLETYALLAQAPIIGAGSYDFVKYALDMAAKYPDDISLQYLAMNTGCSYQTDSGSHYKSCIEAGKRYLALYKAEGHTDEEIMNAQLYVAGQMMLISKTTEAAELAKEYKDTNEYAASMYLSYLYNQKQYADCLEEMKKAVAKWPDNRIMTYQMGVCALNAYDIDSFIDSALSLSSMLKASTDAETTAELDNSLYLLIEHSILSETSMYGTALYSPEAGRYFSEENIVRISEDSFLKDYLDAVYYWYRNNGMNTPEVPRYSQALSAIDRVLAVRDDLPFAHYHKGILYYQRFLDGDTQLAKEELKTAISMDDKQPVFWYMLACTCDRLDEYREAYDACVKVSELLPDSDHDTDVFGVGIHSNNLRRQLESKLKEGN